ncbi:spermatogenesis-defective protein 39 [Trichonephila inaurata madagascariensis]|uniref:Spermatogenesis-defective protein 39 n=1 Tax=Trichonephila inaurata madagascariensis TaxID=2747483 RepID=A0A8X7BSP6_9ARAC|nr:spermatogenesis-defective protein 39 [Trichonephila inaurata madagascariensis]
MKPPLWTYKFSRRWIWSLSIPPSSLGHLSSSIRENDALNQYDLLRCDGLSEVAENKTSSDDILTSHILTAEEEKQAQKIAKSCNPLEFNLKENFGDKILNAEQTIRNIVLGLDYSLKLFKGKDEKFNLLNAAVQSHDGNAILTVVMFLKNTLKRSIFQREISLYPDAINMYLSYLYEDHEVDELSNMLLLLNKPEDAAMLKYDAAILIQAPDRKIKLIENCLNTHFQSGSVNQFLRESVVEHKICIEHQIVLEDHKISSDENNSTTAKLFEELTGKKELYDSSILCNLIFSLLYFYNVPKIASISPTSVKARYNFSPKQYTWCALRVLAALKKWADIEELFSSKNWLSGVKMRSCIGFVKVLDVLVKRRAPPEVIYKYISCLEDQSLKLPLAKKYKCHSYVIEALQKNKDRLGLLEYRNSLPPHSIDYSIATNILDNVNIKWKN